MNVSNNPHIEIIKSQGSPMVADCASPRPSATLAEEFDLAGPDEQQNGRPTKQIEQCEAVANLEALLEAPDVVEENAQDFWAAVQALMDEPDEEDVVPGGSAQEKLLAEQPAALGPLLLVEAPSSGLEPASTNGEMESENEIESENRVSVQGLFNMGGLLPFRNAPVVSEIDATPTWMEVLVVFGQEIQRIRQAQGLSLEQIRLNTQVPVYQLEALESGAVDRLPEEIFVRGFLNRICRQLGPEGKALLAQLPASQAKPQELLADWQQVDGPGAASSQVVTLRSAHLYVGYATLLAGAAGGLAWSFQEAPQVSQTDSLPQPAVQNVYSQAKLSPSKKSAQLRFGLDVALPESILPESSN